MQSYLVFRYRDFWGIGFVYGLSNPNLSLGPKIKNGFGLRANPALI